VFFCYGVDVSDGIKVRLKLSAADILRLADNVIATSTSAHDTVAAVPLDQVCEPLTFLLLCWLNAVSLPSGSYGMRMLLGMLLGVFFTGEL
jgi:hypothetical protein